MKAVAQDRYGGREVLDLRELSEPVCGPGEVRVAVRAAALNPSDWNIRAGHARLLVPYAFPLVLGSDFSGVVIEVGADSTDWKLGDEVFGAADPRRLGTLAETICVRADLIAAKPAALSHTEAAALPVVGQTAWRALFEELRLQSTDRLLVLGGGGAVGSLAVQLGFRAGAEVLATARPRSFASVEAQGVHEVLDASDPARFSSHGEFDAIFDTVGAPERVRALRALRAGGRLVSIAGVPTGRGARAHGVSPPIRVLFDLLSAREYGRAALRRGEYRYFFVDPSGARMRELARACGDDGVRAPVDSVFELAEFAAAFHRLETGRLTGKVVLSIGD
ncbi:MAG: NADP-dependent oxidoreductase [Myxococcales bacterium]|nr:NADP-dependent oxidoreductase [Myxococcales bacterium]